MWMILLQATSGLAALTGIVYCCFSLWAAIRFLRTNRRVSSDDFTPPVSVLKPLCGVDPHAYDSLLSHCIPNFEIISE
jgi:ceramide glucosyltransferase